MRYANRLLLFAFALALGLGLTSAGRATAQTPAASPCLPDTIEKLGRGDYAGVVADCSAVIAEHPNAAAYLMRGRGYYFGGNPHAALSDLDKAIDLAPNDPTNWTFRCQIKKQLRLFSAALDDCEQAFKIAPGLPEAYFARGTLYLNENEFAKALIDFSAYLKSNPNDADSYYNRGLAEENLSDCKDAIPDFTAELRIEGDEPDGLFQRGRCEFKSGEKDASKADLVKAVVMYKNAGDTNGMNAVTTFMLNFGVTNTPTPQPG